MMTWDLGLVTIGFDDVNRPAHKITYAINTHIIIYTLITCIKYEFQLEIIMMGIKWCTAVIKNQVSFKDSRSTFYATRIRWLLVLGDSF
jgi:hypothetical protein